MVERGIEIDSHDLHKGHANVSSVTFAAPVIINGRIGNVGVVVQKTNRQKAHSVRIMAPNGTVFEMDYEYGKKKQTATSAQLLGSSGKYETIKSVSADSIPNSQEDVNSESPDLRFSQKADAGWAAYVSEEAQQRYAQDGRFQRWAHRDLAFISAASWDGVHIPADVLMQNPKIREAQKLTEDRGSSLQKNLPGTNSLVDERRERLAQRLLNAEHGSAVFENGKIKKINGVEQFTGEVEQGRHACIVIGRPAGGKSRVFANPLSNRYKARILDADTVKPWLDGFDDGYGAGYVQDESSLIMEMAFEKAIARGDNVIIPKIGGGSIVDLANRMRSAGYTVDLYYNEVSEETSIMRAASRFAGRRTVSRTGLPIDHSEQSHGNLYKMGGKRYI